MPAPLTPEYNRLHRCDSCTFKAFYATLLLFSLHSAFVVYMNSSYLEQFFSAQTVSVLYIVSSLVTLCGFFAISSILHRIGSITIITGLTLLEFIVLIGMAFTEIPSLVLLLSILHLTIVPIMLFLLDTIMEGLIGNNERATGQKRGLFLTIGGFTLACTALIMGSIVGSDASDFSHVYILSAFLLIPFLFLILKNFGHYIDPVHPATKAIKGVRDFWHKKDVRNVFFSYFLLQLFFSWMVIYSPSHLSSLGFNWEEIGRILFAALMAYVILEYAIGYIADKYFGEKEMMALGFVIMSLSISYISFLESSSIIAWMGLMFLTRVGAALVETTSESYFFKHTKGGDSGAVSMFRVSQPLAYIIGPVIGGILLYFFPLSFIFTFLGILMIPGLFFAMALHDTK